MWVFLKQAEPLKAWNKLAEAQMDLKLAQRILFDPVTDNLIVHLLAVEKTMFPPQTFFSSAYTFSDSYCSICDKRCADCDHIAGRIYMGQICRRKIPKCKITEFSIVAEPKDKRCRMEEYTENGKVYCTLNAREMPQSEPVDPTVRHARGCVLRFD